MPLIKRYSNRKLYDTDARRYVTLEDISLMIRRGEEVQVVEHPSGEDITATILAQIVFAQEKHAGGRLPQMLMTRLIRTSRNTLHDLQVGARALAHPDHLIEEDIRRRLDLLLQQGKITATEQIRLKQLLLSPDLQASSGHNPPINLQPDQQAASRDDVMNLLEKLKTLEKELETIQCK